MATFTLVVPCYNEAKRLDVVAFERFCIEQPGCRFLFVDDGSSDETGELLATICHGHEQCRYLSLPENGGKAAAVRTGILAALESGSEFVGYWDADLATPLEAVPVFVDQLHRHSHLQLVCGARVQLLGRRIDRQPARHYLGRLFATVASRVLALPIYDTQCGAKLFRNNAETQALFALPFRTNWVFDVEILARMWAFRVQNCGRHLSEAIYELPLETWQDVAGSKVRPRDFVRAIHQLLDIHLHYRPARWAARWQPTPTTLDLDATTRLRTAKADSVTRRATRQPQDLASAKGSER